MDLKMRVVSMDIPKEANIIIGQTHFIKSLEDIYEAIVNTNPNMKFGIAFCEASGACLVRVEGNDEQLKEIAAKNAMDLGAGHTFIILVKEGYPINILNALKNVPEVCHIIAATANPLQVVVAETSQGRGILGVIDGASPKGIEDQSAKDWRYDFLRKIGYKK
ncbi:MAG: adenosine-specific kinase [Thermoplasmata archaeon]